MPDDAPLQSEAVPRPDPVKAELRIREVRREAGPDRHAGDRGRREAQEIEPAPSHRPCRAGRRHHRRGHLLVAELRAGLHRRCLRRRQCCDARPQVGGKVLRFSSTQSTGQGRRSCSRIDPRDFAAARDSAQAQLARAQAAEAEASANLDLTKASTAASIASAEAGVDLAHGGAGRGQGPARSTAEADRASADVKRYRTLTKQDYASRQTLDQAEATARSSAAQVLSDTQGVTVAQAKIGQAQAAVDQGSHGGAAGRGQGSSAALGEGRCRGGQRRAPHRGNQSRLYQDPGAADRLYHPASGQCRRCGREEFRSWRRWSMASPG